MDKNVINNFQFCFRRFLSYKQLLSRLACMYTTNLLALSKKLAEFVFLRTLMIMATLISLYPLRMPITPAVVLTTTVTYNIALIVEIIFCPIYYTGLIIYTDR